MIRIDEMILRIPGVDEEEGRQIAQKLTSRLSEALSENESSGIVDDIKINLRLDKSDPDEITDAILEQILFQLKMAVL